MLTSTTSFRPVNIIPADSQAAGTTTGTGFSRIGFDSLALALSLGTLGASGTVDVTIQESDTLGSGYTAVTGAAFAQKTQAGTNMSGLIYGAHLDLRGRKKFLRAVCIVGTATCEVALVGVLYNAARETYVTAAQAASEAAAQGTYDFTV